MSRDSVACVTSKPRDGKPLPQLFLAAHGFVLDDVEDGRLPSGLSYLCVRVNQYTQEHWIYMQISLTGGKLCMYNYSFWTHMSMTQQRPSAKRKGTSRARPALIRVAVAGATGFAGQELIRLLARHPARHHHGRHRFAGHQHAAPPAVAREDLGRHRGAARSRRRFAADAVFLALPEAASAELAPTLLASGPARDRPVGRVSAAR